MPEGIAVIEANSSGVMELPTFAYHPDPLATESFIVSSQGWLVCKQKRGYAYARPLYPRPETDMIICPWCIASGAAACQLQVEFADASCIETRHLAGQKEGKEVMAGILQRTPGFITWQDQIWLAHCHDACQYLGRAGA